MFCLQYATDVKEIRVDKSNVSMETKKIVTFVSGYHADTAITIKAKAIP